ncbi:ABC transporter permease [Coxiella burnetii]|uniref:ABC transporter permease protein n=1 Tax=Coxiella burnetii (strain Dugway 5J108-111) TaxID=434922 RepID=A9KDZ2_COXBN|nr:hypothetical protein [Coxiella burnetii]ABS77879.1 ABC transporter permease protein [Coxiella burnetii Dugway 5J108-111]OYK80485.1 ABC transporter permease [Coxiella burnetii]OYK82443.1 ABC transporter permease [Coxiella burnetii]
MMRTLLTLINREFWEQRGTFFNVPLILAGIFVLVAIAFFILSFGQMVDIGSLQSELANQRVADLIPGAFTAIASPFVLVLWLIVFYYFLGALYDDRKDGSVLFWQSMPTSQTQTIVSKLIAGLILAPFCTWVVVMVTQLIILGIASLFLIIHPILPWTALWSAPVILSAWLHIFAVILFQALWLLPLFAWCLLCSAFAKKAPALRAVVPIIVLIILEILFFSQHYFTDFVISRFQYAAEAWRTLSLYGGQLISHQGRLSLVNQIKMPFPLDNIKLITMWIGILLSLICYILAGWFRSRCYDFER